jgi:hypothetical protein
MESESIAKVVTVNWYPPGIPSRPPKIPSNRRKPIKENNYANKPFNWVAA